MVNFIVPLDYTLYFIIGAAILSLTFGVCNAVWVLRVDVNKHIAESDVVAKLEEVRKKIADGSKEFLKKEYLHLIQELFLMALIIILTVEESYGVFWVSGAYIAGATTSIACGYISMIVGVNANYKTTAKCKTSLREGFITAFRGGSVLGFILVGLGLLNLVILIMAYQRYFLPPSPSLHDYERMLEAIAGYGLGGSSVALFGRVGGGIYTKAADIGADLVGKYEYGLPEDSPDNPATIADNVGDNVGDIAGMGSDLFGSFAESTCAALVISASSTELVNSGGALYFPLLISALGVIICIPTTFLATNCMKVVTGSDVAKVSQYQLLTSTLAMTPVIFLASYFCLPYSFSIGEAQDIKQIKYFDCFFAASSGLWAGLIIGYTTDYYTSYEHNPVQNLARISESGPAMVLVSGLALGFGSTLIPASCIALTIFVSHSLAGMYGVALAAIGMLSTLCICLTLNGYAPIADNAGGIARMANVGSEVRVITNMLDAAGNTTASIVKGFAISSAVLVAFALFGAFVTRSKLVLVDLLSPVELCGLIAGAMLPYAFSAFTLKAVGVATNKMIKEIRRQFLLKMRKPEYVMDSNKCVGVATHSALHQMMLPGSICMFTPLVVGFLFGPKGVAGVIGGALISGVQMAISASNSGGAWDNAKKYVERVEGKKTPRHDAAVIGDVVGDPLKDASGPSINILLKIITMISLVFAGFFERTQLLIPFITR